MFSPAIGVASFYTDIEFIIKVVVARRENVEMDQRKSSAFEGIAKVFTPRPILISTDNVAFFCSDPQIKSRAAMLAFRSMILNKNADTDQSSLRRCRSCPGIMRGPETATVPEIRRTQSDPEVKIPQEVPQPVLLPHGKYILNLV